MAVRREIQSVKLIQSLRLQGPPSQIILERLRVRDGKWEVDVRKQHLRKQRVAR